MCTIEDSDFLNGIYPLESGNDFHYGISDLSKRRDHYSQVDVNIRKCLITNAHSVTVARSRRVEGLQKPYGGVIFHVVFETLTLERERFDGSS
jgi:hypothetical protein